MAKQQDRREFLKRGATAVGGAAVGAGLGAGAVAAAVRPLPQNPRTPAAMPTRNLGRTGFSVGIFSLGGQAAVEQPDNEAAAVAIVESALDLGINYIDTAARYGGDTPWSQTYIGQVMKRRRGEAFLASKTHDRTRDGSLKLLEQSLKLLQTDHLAGRSTTCKRWNRWSRSSGPTAPSRPSSRRKSRVSSATSASPGTRTPPC
jgi:hypothetical protein